MNACKNTNLNAQSPAELAALFETWLQTNKKRKLAVFGCGSDFHNLCHAIPALREKLLCLIDENNAPNTAPIAEALALCPDVIVIASLVHQETMRRKLRFAGYTGEILLPYKTKPCIGALGLLARDPKKDWPKKLRVPRKKKTGQNPNKKNIHIHNILLIAPPFDTANHRHKKTMPMGLLYIAASLRKHFPDIQFTLIDAHIERLDWPAMQARLDAETFDLMLVSYWSAQSRNAFMLSDYVRNTGKAIVVHGGIHATLCPKQAIKHCDAIVPFEGELSVVQLVKDLAGSGLSGQSHCLLSSEYPHALPTPSFIENLDILPFPAWDLLPDVKLYDHPMHVTGGLRFPIVGSRGCPFNCTFCSSPLFWKRKVRWRSPSNVVAEMDAIAERYGVENFHFWDDNMVMNRKWIASLTEELIKRKRSYKWVGLSRASDIVKQRSVLDKMRQAGCMGMEIGVESFADQVSQTVDKGENTVSTRMAADCLKTAGIVPLYTHMLFTPGETINSYRKKEEFLKLLNTGVGANVRSDSALGQLTTPHVKTVFAEQARELGTVPWSKPSDSYHHRVNFLPNSLLDDTPVKAASEMPDPLGFLTVMVQAMYEWSVCDMRRYLCACSLLWQKIDGGTAVRELAGKIAADMKIHTAKALELTALAVAGWGRAGVVRGKYNEEEIGRC